jgi:hypothetical protein
MSKFKRGDFAKVADWPPAAPNDYCDKESCEDRVTVYRIMRGDGSGKDDGEIARFSTIKCMLDWIETEKHASDTFLY